MVFRRGQIFLWLAAAAFLATFVIGSKAGPVMLPAGQSCLQFVTPGVSGVITQDVTPEIARTLHMCKPGGVVVTDLADNPLHRGDVILSINGNPVGCQADFNEQLAHLPCGQPLTLEIYRDGRTQTVVVQRAVEGMPCAAISREPATVDIRGIQATSLSTRCGVIVTDVQIGTPASDAGLKSCDIILDVNGHPVHSAGEFLEFMGDLSSRDAIFNVRHTSGRVDVFVIPA